MAEWRYELQTNIGEVFNQIKTLQNRVDELERENRNRKRDAQMRSLGTDDFYRQNLPFDPGF